MATYKYRIIRRVVECDGLDEDDAERVIVVGNVEGTGSVEYPQKKREFLRVNG